MSAMPKVGLAAAGPAKSKPRGSREKAEQNADADAPIGKFNPSQYYEEIRHLGSGAFGAAVLVRRLKDGRRLVAKKCSVKDMEEKQRRMCFEEIALLQKVRHECVAQLVDFVWASKDMLSYWIVLKFYPGGDVQSEIDTCRENQLELPIGKVKNWVTQLCMALKHVHKLRIVHRDVKGSNMFISGARNIVLGDFGVSKQLTESEQKAMTSVGSPMYMAPEWWDGRGGTANSDMWSVGVVLFELMALHRPFEAQNVLSLVHKITTEEPAALPEDADPQLSSLAMQLLDKRPERRPSAAEVLQAKGLEDAEKILQIYREALEKKSDRHQRRLAREEDAAAGKRPRRFSRSSSMSSECESSGNAAGFRGINLVDIARRLAFLNVEAT
ncbi:Serine/threonine-protein kinase Nek1 (Never in mitosis A-related kinase 1) (NimA-related protein kinase 1) [Durusdinium trenchii]|uniref:non-specific serine/threonine protein kinase n=1 Tax=Durusdinium trenchii TaxID=1381693 RepID=A0ABP0M9G9_9DINO